MDIPTIDTTSFTLNENLILVKETVKDREEIIRKLGGLLYDNSFVKDSYTKAVLERESVFPTGIATSVTGVAIPHTDSIHVNRSAIAIATLERPIVFEAMGYPEKSINNVRLVMMLAIQDPKKVMEVIRQIMKIFTTESILNSILDASSAQAIQEAFFRGLN